MQLPACMTSQAAVMIIGSITFILSAIGAISTLRVFLDGAVDLFVISDSLPFVVLETFLFIKACSSVLLIIGARIERHSLMLPWLAYFLLEFLNIIATILVFVINYFFWGGKRTAQFQISFTSVGEASVYIVMTCVCYAAVYNHYKRLLYGKPVESSAPYTITEPMIKPELSSEKSSK